MKTWNLIYKKQVNKCQDLTHEEIENYVPLLLFVSKLKAAPLLTCNHVTLDNESINLKGGCGNLVRSLKDLAQCLSSTYFQKTLLIPYPKILSLWQGNLATY